MRAVVPCNIDNSEDIVDTIKYNTIGIYEDTISSFKDYVLPENSLEPTTTTIFFHKREDEHGFLQQVTITIKTEVLLGFQKY